MAVYRVTLKESSTWDRVLFADGVGSKSAAMRLARAARAGLYQHAGGDVTVERDGEPIYRWVEQAEYSGPVSV